MSPDPSSRTLWILYSAICLYAARMAVDLPAAWAHDPLTSKGAPAFLIWSAGALLCARLGRKVVPGFSLRTSWLLASLLMGTAGVMGELNLLGHLSLSAGVCSMIPLPGQRLILFLASACWMPAFGWVGQLLDLGLLDGWRVLIASLATISSPLLLRLPSCVPTPCTP